MNGSSEMKRKEERLYDLQKSITQRLKEVFMKNKEMCSVLPNALYTGFWRERSVDCKETLVGSFKLSAPCFNFSVIISIIYLTRSNSPP